MAVNPTPDWMRSLLPDGGKVSLTVHSAPGATQGGSTVPSVDPNTGVTLPAGTAPTAAPPPKHVVAALRDTGPANVNSGGGTGPVHTPDGGVLNDPHGPQHPPVNNPTTPTPATGGYRWWNPYTGRYENVPGVDVKGHVLDANTFWTYYNKYPAAGLDSLAQSIANANLPENWQHQYTDAEKQAMVTGNSDYITQLGNINHDRYNDLFRLGDLTDEQIKAFGLNPDQVRAIRENPVSTLNALRRALTSNMYGMNAASASHGAWSSGARNQDASNLQEQNVRDVLGAKLDTNDALGKDDTRVSDLFRDTKDKMEQDGNFDPGDTEHNKAAWQATHATIAAAEKNADNFLKHLGNGWKTESSVANLRSMMKNVDEAINQYGKVIDAKKAGELKDIRDAIRKRIHDIVMGRKKGGGTGSGGGVLTRTSTTPGPAGTNYPNVPTPDRPTKPIVMSLRGAR